MENYCTVTEYNILVKLKLIIQRNTWNINLSVEFLLVLICFYFVFQYEYLVWYISSVYMCNVIFESKVIFYKLCHMLCGCVTFLFLIKITSGSRGRFHTLQLVQQGSVSLCIISKGLVYFISQWTRCQKVASHPSSELLYSVVASNTSEFSFVTFHIYSCFWYCFPPCIAEGD